MAIEAAPVLLGLALLLLTGMVTARPGPRQLVGALVVLAALLLGGAPRMLWSELASPSDALMLLAPSYPLLWALFLAVLYPASRGAPLSETLAWPLAMVLATSVALQEVAALLLRLGLVLAPQAPGESLLVLMLVQALFIAGLAATGLLLPDHVGDHHRWPWTYPLAMALLLRLLLLEDAAAGASIWPGLLLGCIWCLAAWLFWFTQKCPGRREWSMRLIASWLVPVALLLATMRWWLI